MVTRKNSRKRTMIWRLKSLLEHGGLDGYGVKLGKKETEREKMRRKRMTAMKSSNFYLKGPSCVTIMAASPNPRNLELWTTNT
mmetsp:Transcript_118608/g.343026  ORF Transcript_118608/g.343026 Transcript_118608/m.343026 type:complete len:83 (-) Transcript_118608:247-495(-)